ISQLMGIPFQIGSDGAKCWFYSPRPDDHGVVKPTLITCNYDDIQTKNLLFLEPFDFDIAKLDEIANERRLEYLGLEEINQTQCHVVRSIRVAEWSEHKLIAIIVRWWIDSKTYRPVQVANDGAAGPALMTFEPESLNMQLPITEFQPAVPAGAIQSGL